MMLASHFGQIVGVGKMRDRIAGQDTKMERLLRVSEMRTDAD